MVRASCVDKNGLRKGAWTQEEDNKLRAYILRYGHWNWRLLPQYAGLARCGNSCRLRWMNYLKPGIKRGAYSKEEEDLIAKLHHELGNKWSVIAAKLPGRTDNEIKNYWHTHLKNGSKRKSSKSSVMSSDVLIFQNQEQNNISNDENMISRHMKNSNSNSNSGNMESLEASSSDHHIHILESSSSKSCCNIDNPSTTNCTSLNWNSADSTTTSISSSSNTYPGIQRTAKSSSSCFLSYDDQPAAAALRPSQTTDSTQLQNIIQDDDIFCAGMINSRATHDPSDITFGGFGDSFWTQPFLVDTQIDYNYNDNFSLLDDDEDASFVFTNSSDI